MSMDNTIPVLENEIYKTVVLRQDGAPAAPTHDKQSQDMSFADKMTLECLLNRGKYQKILARTDPTTYQEYQEYRSQLRKHRDIILEMIEKMIDRPKTQYSRTIDYAFETLAKHCIRYLDERETMQESDDDTLFPE
jgi:hypothetical protein